MKSKHEIWENRKAPRDPEKKGKSFYIMRNKEIAGSVQPDGRGIQFLYLNGGRLKSSARIIGHIEQEEILKLLETAGGFCSLVDSIGVSAEAWGFETQRVENLAKSEAAEPETETVEFVFQMYGKTDPYASGTSLRMTIRTNGMEHILKLSEQNWSQEDDVPGQIRFEFERAGRQARISVRLYLKEGYDVPEPEEEHGPELESAEYEKLLMRSVLQTGNTLRLKGALDRARRGEEVTIAFIGGSVTQGAGAVPLHTGCYAFLTFQAFCKMVGKGIDENIHYRKAGVGGTSSELGMIRYERDVLRDAQRSPDIVVVEFAVNDEGDETKGECYESLVKKILCHDPKTAVILLFAVFADDFNLQDRLIPIGERYELPMVSIRNAVVGQFYKSWGEGKLFDKSQFFYDAYHPTNLGHTVMKDCLMQLFRTMEEQCGTDSCEETDCGSMEYERIPGGEFWKVRLLDRKENPADALIKCGSFRETDRQLQAVEMDLDTVPTGMFPYNWMYCGRLTKREEYSPFTMEICCTSLFLIFKDSGSACAGAAGVFVDGEQVLLADPSVNGWTHCNAVLCFRSRPRKIYHVEVSMRDEDMEKDFTILGFGYVE